MNVKLAAVDPGGEIHEQKLMGSVAPRMRSGRLRSS